VPRTKTTYERIVAEILGDVDVFVMSGYGDSPGGPNGPWTYRSLTVHREDNAILVEDVDGRRIDKFPVSALASGEPNGVRDHLRGRLERLNDESLGSL
jgi:hypothetical protein